MHNSSYPLEEISRYFSFSILPEASSHVKGSLLFDEGNKIVFESFQPVFEAFTDGATAVASA